MSYLGEGAPIDSVPLITEEHKDPETADMVLAVWDELLEIVRAKLDREYFPGLAEGRDMGPLEDKARGLMEQAIGNLVKHIGCDADEHSVETNRDGIPRVMSGMDL